MTMTPPQINADVLKDQLRREYRQEVARNSHGFNLHIKVSATDYDLLNRIAEEQERRLSDLLQLIFSQGLESYFGDEGIRFTKREEEYTDEELAALKVSKELTQSEGWDDLSWEERRAKGYVHSAPVWRNFSYACGHELGTEEDNLIEPMAKRIKSFAQQETEACISPA